jgi:hypothetical protein
MEVLFVPYQSVLRQIDTFVGIVDHLADDGRTQIMLFRYR